jgi:O-6-methylguanine DNA methyltransferase
MIPDLQSAKTLSDFQKRVLASLSLVPQGHVTTYAALAEFIDCPSPRAVGQALRKNPASPKIPCHRIVRADGSLGGFFGSTSPALAARKIALLAAEGVIIGPTGRVPDHLILRSLKKDRSRQRPLPTSPAAAAK